MSRLVTLRGRPTSLELCSVFLLHPGAVMKLDGEPIRATFTAAGRESLYKGLERASELNLQRIPPHLETQFVEFLDSVAPKGDPLAEITRRAFAGNPQATAELAQIPPWDLHLRSRASAVSEDARSMLAYFVEIERESRDIDRLIAARLYHEAAQAIAQNPQLRRYVTSAALEQLESAWNTDDLLWVQIVGAIAALVSQVALLERLRRARDAREDGFAHLLEVRFGRINTGRKLTHWFKLYLGARSITDLLELQVEMRKPLDESTWKRWHSGANFPGEESLWHYVDHVFQHAGDKEQRMKKVGAQYWAARRLDHVVGVLEYLESLNEERTAHLLGAPAVQWLPQVYKDWCEHWTTEKLPCQ